MTVAEKVVEMMKVLPPEKQQEVLDFIESLATEPSPGGPLINPEGLWAGRGCDITHEELAEARREMWSKFYGEDAQ